MGDKILRKDSRSFKNVKPKDHKGKHRSAKQAKRKVNDKFFERSTDRSSNEGE
jgi:hypothetical protein